MLVKENSTFYWEETAQNNTTNGVFTAGAGYTNDALLSSVSNAPNRVAGSNYGQYNMLRCSPRINYNWQDKYLINLTARRDGSSRFGPGKQYGNFGGIGAAWIFSEEEFLKQHLPFLSFGKLRSSYGIVGGDQIQDYSYLTQYTFVSSGLYNGIQPLVPLKHTDSLLHWQTNHKTEIAIDLNFLKTGCHLK